MSNVSSPAATKEVVITRTLQAPRELVFKAWTDAKHLRQWWSPECFTNPRCEADPRPSGSIRIDMQGPDGTIYPMGGTYHEIREFDRIVLSTRAIFDESGNPSLEVRHTVTFEELNGATQMTIRSEPVIVKPEAAGAIAGMEIGFSQSFDKLQMLVEAVA